MVAHEGIAEQPDVISRWSEALEELHGHIAHRFVRSEARKRVRRYLLGRVELKNDWQLAEAIGEVGRRPPTRRLARLRRTAPRR